MKVLLAATIATAFGCSDSSKTSEHTRSSDPKDAGIRSSESASDTREDNLAPATGSATSSGALTNHTTVPTGVEPSPDAASAATETADISSDAATPNTGTDEPDTSDAGASTQQAGSSTNEPWSDAPDASGPLPVEIDETGLVPTSDRWVLFSSGNSDFGGADLVLLDLEQGITHIANDGGEQVAIGSLSPDERTFFYSNGNGASRNATRVVRLLDDGFVPGVPAYDVAGAFRVLGWSEDSRFAVMSNGNGSVEIYDFARLTSIYSEEMSGISGSFAPKGHQYYFYQREPHITKVARVSGSGTSAPLVLPEATMQETFDLSGERLYYLHESGEQRFMYYVDLPDGVPTQLDVGVSQQLYYVRSLGPNGVVVRGMANDESFSVYRVVAGSGAQAETLSVPGQYALEPFAADDGAFVALPYREHALELVRFEPFTRATLQLADEAAEVGFVGRHLYYTSAGVSHVATIDEQGLTHDMSLDDVGLAATACAGRYSYEPRNKLALLSAERDQLLFVDLSGPEPHVVGAFTRMEPDGELGCPIWGDGDTALTVVETFESGSALYVLGWNQNLSEPTLAQTSEGVLHAYAVRYR